MEGRDRLRPLDERGRDPAVGLAAVLAGHAVERMVSSPFLRSCRRCNRSQRRLGSSVEPRRQLAEGAGFEEQRAIAAELG